MKQWIEALPFRKQLFRACLWALIVTTLISGIRALITYDDATSIYLSISIKSPKEGVAALYYDTGKGFNSNHVANAFIRGNNRFYDYLYKIPNRTLYNMRWDPLSASRDPISIRKIEILNSSRNLVKPLSLKQLEPLHQIRTLEASEERVDILVQEGANDPQVKIRLDSPVSVKGYLVAAKFAAGVLLEFAGLFLAACLLAFIWIKFGDKAVATVIVAALVIFGWRCWMLYDDAVSLFLQANMRSSINSTAQVYYDLGLGMNEKDASEIRTTAGETIHSYRLRLPNKPIYELRFDPMTASGKVWIGELKITNAFGKVLENIDLRQLKPKHQITAMLLSKDGLEITTAENAEDPQLGLTIENTLNFENKLPFPLLPWLLAIMAELILFALIALVLILLWKRWGMFITAGMDSTLVQERLPLLYLGTAFGLMLAMGYVSGLDVNPDEWGGHIKAAAYYLENWLPPAVDDPRIVPSITVFGISYLWHIDPFYLLAAKAAKGLSGVVSDFYLRLRLFNAMLFLLLVLTVAFQIRRSKWLVPLLVVTPQMWYVFSYFNNDAFPLLISILLAMQILDPESSLNRFLASPGIRPRVSGGVLTGILMGLLISSKLNYRLYIAFLLFVALWGILFEAPGSEKIPRAKKWILIGFVALLVYLPIYGYDQYINDFKKDEKVMTALEKYAVPEFKPSTLKNDISSSYKGLRLKEKGITFQELFLRSSDWRDMSFKSFFGVYGYMDLVSEKDYYQAVTYALGIFFLIVFFYVAFTLPIRDVIFFLFVLLFVGLFIGQSVYHSWINDYQPQGRYLFPILPVLLVGLARLPASFRTRIMPLFGLVFFMLSVWSFLMTGLKMIPKIN